MHRPLFTLFLLQFGAMSPNGAIKLERVSSIARDKASVEDLQHYASLLDMNLKELSIPNNIFYMLLLLLCLFSLATTLCLTSTECIAITACIMLFILH